MSEEDLMKLPKKELVERCWAATVNADFAGESAAEAWAEVAKLTAVLENDKLIEAVCLYIRLKEHQAHVVKCQTGSCEDEFDALVRAGVTSLSASKRLRAAPHPTTPARAQV